MIGKKNQIEFFEKIGFNKKINIENKESSAPLGNKYNWGKLETATIGFGHGFAITPLHLVKAYALGANFAFMGRPWSMAYAANNRHGIENYIKYLCKETSVAMAMIGRRKIEEICFDDILWN